MSNDVYYRMCLAIFPEELCVTSGDGIDAEDDNRISGIVIE
jgi:hypothetical protein